MMKIFNLLMLLAIMGLFGVGQVLYESNGNEYNVYNMTDKFQWNYSYTTLDNNLTSISGEDISQSRLNRLHNIIHKFVDFVGYASFEVVKFGVEFGFEHPEYNFYYFVKVLKIIIWINILSIIIPMIIPLVAIIYMAYDIIRNLGKKLRKRKEERGKR